MRRRDIAGTEKGTPEEFRYKGFAELDRDNIPDGEYTDEDLRLMSEEVEQSMVSFFSIDFSKYRSVSY